MRKLNVGIIGYGWVATAHIAAINATAHAQVTAVYSARPLDPALLASRHGPGIRTFDSVEALLADPSIDVISICSYPWLHAEHAQAAAKAGKHLIIEKPLALSWDDCLAVRDAVAEAGVLTCVCFECRYSAQFLSTRSVIDSGLLGTVHYGEVDYYHGIGPWYGQYRWNVKKEGGGSSLLSAGCHALDALLLCLGSDVAEVHSMSTKSRSPHFAPYEYDTSAVTLVKFRDGRVGKTASIIDCVQPYYFHTHLVGSEGSLLDNRFHSTRLGALNKGQWSNLSFPLVDSGDVKDHPYQSQFEAFFEAIGRREEMKLTSLADALETHRVIFAADESARTGRPVTLV
jgi:predicted dehydrogenase